MRFLTSKTVGFILLVVLFPSASSGQLFSELRDRVRQANRDQLSIAPAHKARVRNAKEAVSRQHPSPDPIANSSVSQTGPISGYMDFHFNDRQESDPVLDFHRFVLLFNHSFSERVRFVAELELEHAVVSDETDGELELEQAYVDFLISRPFNARVGMVLAPVGVINERHEPPVYHGVERPSVETVINPTTWFGAGVIPLGSAPSWDAGMDGRRVRNLTPSISLVRGVSSTLGPRGW